MLLCHLGKTFLTAFSHIDLNLSLLQKPCKHREIHLGIIHRKNSCLWCSKALMIPLTACIEFPKCLLKISDRFPFYHFLLQMERKCRSLPIFTFNLQPTIHHLEKILSDIHSKSCSLNVTVTLLLDTLKGREQLFNILLLDSYSRVCHRHI